MKRFISIMTVITVLVFTCVSFGAASVYKYGDWTLTALNTDGDTAFGVRSYDGADAVVTVPDNYGGYPIIALNNYAFAANKTVREIVLNDQITTIGNSAFLSATNLETVTLTSSVSKIGESAFSDTPALKSINLEDSSIESIGKNAFLNSGIEEIILPDNCTSIGDGAFAQCEDLTKIEIPDSVTSIGDDAFRDSDKVVIYGTADSYAVAYAKEHEIDYVRTNVVTYILGDADGNGVITVLDATLIQRYLAGIPVPNPEVIERNCDLDGNGIDIADVTWILRSIADIEVPYPVGSLAEAIL